MNLILQFKKKDLFCQLQFDFLFLSSTEPAEEAAAADTRIKKKLQPQH